ncbi:hypothetical protein pEaSNUABM11_00240 [Erwinia phage pEa_SNUABM_11]|nr:hypothetical protein pEaSNUABM11_00240 [Erwinia phage pEa_SNUABM_11]
MQQVKMHILMALEDYFKRMSFHEEAVKTAYLIAAREISKQDYIADWAPLSGMWQALRFIVHEGGLELALADEYIEPRIMKKVRQLLLALMGDFDNFPRHSMDVNRSYLGSISEVKASLDMPLVFARDEDLLNYSLWFAGEMESPCYVQHRMIIETQQEWCNLVTKYPHGPYMWRADWDAFVPDINNMRHKHVMILDVESERERFEIISKGK